MRIETNHNSPTSRAKLLSQWKCLSANKTQSRNISIVALDKSDKVFADYILNLSKNIDYLEKARQHVLEDTAVTLKGILNSKDELDEKLKLYVAVYDAKPCGLLIANMPKLVNENGNIAYSSRHNGAKNETELDWLVTWYPDKDTGIRGVGKALLGEYFRTLKSDNFRDVYVRSELPENSTAQDFYETLGFEILSEKRKMWESRTTNLPLVRSCDNVTELMVPMIITKKKITDLANNLSEKMFRRGFIKNDVGIDTIIDMWG